MTIYPFHGYDRFGQRLAGFGDDGGDFSSSGSSSADFGTTVDPVDVTGGGGPGSDTIVQGPTSILPPDIVIPSPTPGTLPSDLTTTIPDFGLTTPTDIVGTVGNFLNNILGKPSAGGGGGSSGGGSSSTAPKPATTPATPVSTSPYWVLAAIGGGIGLLALGLSRPRSNGIVIVEPRPYSGGRRR